MPPLESLQMIAHGGARFFRIMLLEGLDDLHVLRISEFT